MTDLLKEKFLSTIDEVLKHPLMPPQRELLEGLRKTFLVLAEDEKKAEPTNPAHRLDCSLAVNFLPEKLRMCESYVHCEDCPNNKKCDSLEFSISPEIVNIVQAWSDENPPAPVKTILDDFKKKHPDYFSRRDTRYPSFTYPCMLGYKTPHAGTVEGADALRCTNSFMCDECWNEPLKEGE